MKFFAQWLATAVAAAVATWLIPGFVPLGDTLTSVIVFALAIALVNASIRPIMQALSLPLTILTLGFFHLVVNALALMLASWLSQNLLHMGVYVTGFWAAFFGSIVISLVSSVVGSIMGVEE